MKFNQVIWDALVCAIRKGCPGGLDAISAYASACDGKVRGVVTDGKRTRDAEFEFIPNPIPKY